MKKSVKKITSIFLSLLMVLSVCSGFSFAASAADTPKAIELVSDGALDCILGAQQSSVWFGNYKQSSNGAGGYNVEPVKWRVLSNDDDENDPPSFETLSNAIDIILNN